MKAVKRERLSDDLLLSELRSIREELAVVVTALEELGERENDLRHQQEVLRTRKVHLERYLVACGIAENRFAETDPPKVPLPA